jgi:hypothetical protein
MVTGGAVRSQFEVLEASRQACVDEEVAGVEAKLQGFTAMLGRTPYDGDGDGGCGQGFGVERNWDRGGRRGRLGSSRALYGA